MTPSERIKALIKHSGLNAHSFSKALGYSSGALIYRTLNDNVNISVELAERIQSRFPEISKGWLVFDEGDMFLSDNKAYQDLKQELDETKILLKICLESNLNLSHIVSNP